MNIKKMLLLTRVVLRMYRKKPTFVSFNVTNQCNERCLMCAVWRVPSETLSVLELEPIFADLKHFGILLVEVSGGEPFLRPDIFEVFSMLERQGFLYTLSTNGTVLNNDHVSRLLGLRGLLQIAISLDSLDRGLYATLRGQDLLPVVQKNIENLAKLTVAVPLKLNFTMSRANYPETFQMLEYAKSRGLYLSVFPINQGEGFLHRYHDPVFSATEDDKKQMADIFMELSRLRKNGEPLWEYSQFYKVSADYVLGKSIGHCDAGNLYLDLHSDGKLAVCIEHESFADLRNEKIMDVWPRIDSEKVKIRDCDTRTPCCYTCTFNVSITARNLFSFIFETAKMQGRRGFL